MYDGVNTSLLVTLMLEWTSDVTRDDVKRVEKLDFQILEIKYNISYRIIFKHLFIFCQHKIAELHTDTIQFK